MSNGNREVSEDLAPREDFAPQTLFYSRINSFQQILPSEIGTGGIIRKFLALLWPRHMDRTALAQLPVKQKNTGTVIFNLESIPFLNKSLSHLSVTEMEVAGNSVDINGSNKED